MSLSKKKLYFQVILTEPSFSEVDYDSSHLSVRFLRRAIVEMHLNIFTDLYQVLNRMKLLYCLDNAIFTNEMVSRNNNSRF